MKTVLGKACTRSTAGSPPPRGAPPERMPDCSALRHLFSNALFAGALVALGGCAAAGGAGLGIGAIGTALALMLGLAGCTSSHGRGTERDAGIPEPDADVGEDGGGADRDRDGWEAGRDCNDDDARVYPGAEELCDLGCEPPYEGGVDEDCDGAIDESCPIVNCFPEDYDGDGWHFGEDCDDYDHEVYPGADEQCTGLCDPAGDARDNDCDGAVDEDCVVTNCVTDADGDGYTVEGWGHPADCDDTRDWVNPGATEMCYDGVDNDCDGAMDDADPEGCVIVNGMADVEEEDSAPA